jgi:2-dehydro-3-deoxygalactonokinase
MIGLDWGTTSLRAWRLAPDGALLESRAAPRGILTVPAGGFPAVLQETVGDWIAAGEMRILICGMAGSRQGWAEAPYLPLPADPSDLARALLPLSFEGAEVLLVPGLSGRDADGIPDVIRGEETQIAGLGLRDATICLPGSHSKWVTLREGRVTAFATHMTGEVFAALTGHTILARTTDTTAPPDWAAFDAGAARVAAPGGLLHHLFGARALHLVDGMTSAASASWLSGLLIGHEIAAAAPQGTVHVVGSGPLVERYARLLGPRAVRHGEEAGMRGLYRLSQELSW